MRSLTRWLLGLWRSLTRWPRRRQPAPKANFFWRFGFPAVVVAAGVAVLVLANEGGRAVLNRTVETVYEEVVLQPDEPGYLELVAVTPTLLSLHTHEGELSGVALMARTGIDAGGGVVLLPADLLLVPSGATAEDVELLGDAYVRGGADAVERAAETLLGIGFDQVVELSTESLAEAMAPAAPLPYLLADDLAANGADGTVQAVYEAGRHDLAAADAAVVYSLRNSNEADVNRVQRQRAMWLSWLDVVARADDPAAVLPALSPLEPFLQALGAATAVVEVPPLQSVAWDPGAPPRYLLGEEGQEWLRAEVLELVPRPRQPEWFPRPRVRLLDGTGDPAVRDALVDDIIAAGGVVTVIGNAAEFGVDTTQFAYHREELVRDPITNSIAIELGVDMALIELDETTPDVADITVTVGSDQAAR